MACAPGKHYRKGLSLIDAVQKFSSERDAEDWFIAQRWPNGWPVRCADRSTFRSARPVSRCRSDAGIAARISGSRPAR